MPGPSIKELMSRQQQHHYENPEDDDDEEDDDEEEDFVERRKRPDSDSDDDEGEDLSQGPSKRARYSSPAGDGYARASPPAQPPAYGGKGGSYGQSHAVPGQIRPHSPGLKGLLEHSILNVEPVDELVREVADFVYKFLLMHSENVEIEAKIGVLRDGTGQRIRYPVTTETVLLPDTPGVRFESNMAMSQHQHYNQLLNKLSAPPPKNDVRRTPLKYAHTKLVDTFYQDPDNPREKIRVTTDESGRVLQCIRKVRLGDLNIYSPKRNADWRVSVNLEIPVPQPEGAPTLSRKKDRLSYTHQYCNIDLTQVKQALGANTTVQHELELEFNPTAMPIIMHAASRRQSLDSSVSPEQKEEYDDIIKIFVNDARILVRNASGAWGS